MPTTKEKFLKLLNESGTEYTKISENEICIETIAISAYPEQGDMLPEKEYTDNPLCGVDDKIHISFYEDGTIGWSIIHVYEADEDEEMGD